MFPGKCALLEHGKCAMFLANVPKITWQMCQKSPGKCVIFPANVLFLTLAHVLRETNNSLTHTYTHKKILCFTLRSWLHKSWTKIKSCPLDWRTTIYWNIVRTIFNINSYVKIVEKFKINILMYHNSPIQGTRSAKEWKLLDKSVLHFQQESGHCPLDWRIILHWNVVLAFFQQPWYMPLCWKFAITSF